MKVVILAGGFGTRISEESHLKPKPMIEIGEKPILWHIMKEYSAYGINEFIICAGYKQHVIGLYAASISTLVSYASTALYRRIDIRKYIKIKVNVKNILLNSVAVVFVTLSYYFNITILNVAALVIACIYAVGINWKLIKMFFAEIRKYKKEGN